MNVRSCRLRPMPRGGAPMIRKPRTRGRRIFAGDRLLPQSPGGRVDPVEMGEYRVERAVLGRQALGLAKKYFGYHGKEFGRICCPVRTDQCGRRFADRKSQPRKFLGEYL